MAYEYVRQAYGVDPVPGQRVRFTEGKPRFGMIASRRAYDHYVWVRFDGEKHPSPCHPTSLDYSAVEPPPPEPAP